MKRGKKNTTKKDTQTDKQQPKVLIVKALLNLWATRYATCLPGLKNRARKWKKMNIKEVIKKINELDENIQFIH